VISKSASLVLVYIPYTNKLQLREFGELAQQQEDLLEESKKVYKIKKEQQNS